MKKFELTKKNIAMYNNQIRVIRLLYIALRSNIKFSLEYNRKELKRLLSMANRGLSNFQNGVSTSDGKCVSAFHTTKGFGQYYDRLELILKEHNLV